jgi:L-lactate dehydrogenase (cytochrome)
LGITCAFPSASARLYAWALGAGGEAALVNTLEILEGEIRNAMGLLGVSRLDELNPRYVTEARPVA